ncbi:RING finger protein 39 isoform X1 [Pogona vitticeps]
MQHLAPMPAVEGKGLVAELQRAAICPACRGHFKDPVTLDCDHSYCRACITRHWEEAALAGKGPRVLSCPQCKKVFERKNLRTNVKLAVEVKITQHLNAKTAEAPFAPKSRRRRGGWVGIPKEKASQKSADANEHQTLPDIADHSPNTPASQPGTLPSGKPWELLPKEPNKSPAQPTARRPLDLGRWG